MSVPSRIAYASAAARAMAALSSSAWMQGADSDGRSICLYEFGEYLGGLLPVMDLTGSVVDFGSHHRQVFRIGRDRHALREVLAQDPVRVLVAATLPGRVRAGEVHRQPGGG